MGILDELARQEAERPAEPETERPKKRHKPRVFAKPADRYLAPEPSQDGNLQRGPGRPRGAGIAKMIRDATQEGAEIVEYYLAVFRGEARETKPVQRSSGKVELVDVPPSMKDRMAAADWLATRGFGKVPETVHVETTHVEATIVAFDQLPVEQALQLYELSRHFLPASTAPAEPLPAAAWCKRDFDVE